MMALIVSGIQMALVRWNLIIVKCKITLVNQALRGDRKQNRFKFSFSSILPNFVSLQYLYSFLPQGLAPVG